ncbi:SDR family oxidoreductase [Vitiosangium sp. GDMCC 1.1324]|uniref:SDR family oxidoreductase n=1 Tax=Vitiosangium sp. (strain GDMCC 1.1324) TaxID=2138576 RepID=UPI000D352BA2|nr:SDR family oxidoreductase [Vitiosangium sp. GDMCC 1.1324]PTL85724.1 short-chain dehydrogenase [Vitiosangium sp. GDMCC 1.1324]
MKLESRRVIVVGAGSGIGRSVAIAASEAGASVVLAGRKREALEATAALLKGPREVRPLDASREDEVGAFFETIGPFDHLVSTASQGASGSITELGTAAIERAFAAKLWAPIFLVKHAARRIAREGSFTFFSGFRAVKPSPGASITSLVNGGLEAFTKAMAVELAPIRVNAISPGVVDSGSFWDRLGTEARDRLFSDFAQKAPARRVGQPEDLAAATLFAMVNPFLTGTVLAVDGGGHLM